MIGKMNDALRWLCEKYNVGKGEMISAEGVMKLRLKSGTESMLLPWRVERRFSELKNLIRNQTLEGVSTLRFASMTAGGKLEEQLARELDLAIWLSDSGIHSLFAVCSTDNSTANVIVKLKNAVSVCVECGNKLPPGTNPMDRHEIIAQRGVASDRVVDTQIPQFSIYCFAADGETCYTDTDAELFGMNPEEILLVRAAFAVLSNPGLAIVWNDAAAEMKHAAAAVFESDRTQSVITF